ncbi:FAD-dependent oxidoreductase [Paraflavisolibacter sp. H34]|uniref:NAD(P)/FAD-dependent oxidoreductase n=1 Tax=Huijunlia imazamoxiresistens TaxID=3127457 RepID=UPI003019BEEB
MVSIWEQETFFAPQDVVIAGSGFTGLWSAYWLKKKHPSWKITVADRSVIPAGASTRNAGFACFGSVSELVYDAGKMGAARMLELVAMRFRGLQQIRDCFGADRIDFDPCGGYELYDAADSLSASRLEKNIHFLNGALKAITGTHQTFERIDEELPSFGFGHTRHLVRNRLEGALHSGKLLQALLQTVQGMGVQVFPSTAVTAFEPRAGSLEIATSQPFRLQARQLLVCTNAFARQLLPRLDVVPARGQVLLTSPIRDLPWKGTFHSDEGFYYFRNLGDRVLLGGARNKAFDEEETTEMHLTPLIQNELEAYLAQVVLPHHAGRYTIDYRWSGIMAMGGEKMPLVQQVAPGVFCAVRMSGMGVALAPLAGQRVSEMMSDG